MRENPDGFPSSPALRGRLRPFRYIDGFCHAWLLTITSQSRLGGRLHLTSVLLGKRPGHRARASQGRLRPFRILTMAVVAVALSSAAGGFAYFLPALAEALDATGQAVVVPSPSPSPTQLVVPSPKPTPRTPGAFTVLLLGSDNDSKFIADRVLTQSMILVRVSPATKKVTMPSIPRDLYVPLSTGGSGKIDGAYSY